MASKTRQQLGILAALVAVLFAVLVYNRGADPLVATSATTVRPAASARASQAIVVDAVRLAALSRPRPEPQEGSRNPFRFRPAPPPPPAPAISGRPNTGAAASLMPGMPAVPAAPAGPPPIALKFIGVVEQAPSRLKLAVLSDGRNVFYGKEGDTIEGRYRIERIGVESIDMAYIDGRGRQTLRLSGS
jgi:hypothetical protein